MKASNGGSTLPKVPMGQDPGGNLAKLPLTKGASVVKSASSNLMTGTSAKRGQGFK